MVRYFKEQMESVVGASVDLLFCNEEEAALILPEKMILKALERN